MLRRRWRLQDGTCRADLAACVTRPHTPSSEASGDSPFPGHLAEFLASQVLRSKWQELLGRVAAEGAVPLISSRGDRENQRAPGAQLLGSLVWGLVIPWVSTNRKSCSGSRYGQTRGRWAVGLSTALGSGRPFSVSSRRV